ncbi:LysR family transcriptional regulator [Nonomuraea basaltis]|uniref:LysR family transcriptional regulator n=1 Tax=Nonomuraea basaltis TaxID=2495887 RepID=UPI00110C649D|nr:LysR family transcriptional regulator [Nonomuraea basaltis]TMR92134.1 LysR family transcriptional regulator [Nonomuraea basaltis]
MRLFERGPRNLWQTPAAVQMGRHAAAILSRLGEAEEDIRGYAAGRRGRLRVAAFATVGAQVLPKALARLVYAVVEGFGDARLGRDVYDAIRGNR